MSDILSNLNKNKDSNVVLPKVFGRLAPMMPIVIIDDSDIVLKSLKHLLRTIGFRNIIPSRNANEAWEIIIQGKVELIFCDWEMPGTSGLDLLERLRADNTLSHIPFVLVTARSGKDSVVKAIKGGVTNYIVKPITQGTLEDKLKEIFLSKPI